jgi:uncharacterized 2Fe-2S/4Fe-4S cluster protein (DUF4445 family)
MAITVEIVSHGRKIKAVKGRILADVLLEAGIPMSVYCRKRGLCGKCFVEILDGPRPPLQEQEKKLLSLRGLSPDHRLACLFVLEGGLRVSIPDSSTLGAMSILSWGVESAAVFDPAVKKYLVEPDKPGLVSPESSWDSLERALKITHLRTGLDMIGRMSDMMEQAHPRLTAVVYQDAEVLALEPGDTTSRVFGLAVDLGTTTLVLDLVNLDSGRVVDSETALNSQSSFGADVVSRISLVFAEPDQADRVRKAVVKDLNRMLGTLLERHGLRSQDVYEAVVAGNTAMNHLFLGAPVKSLALAPFNAAFSVLPPVPARDVGLEINPNGRVYIAPNIRSFVGGDIAAGLMASGFFDRRGTLLYLDLGTNGEIVLKKGDTVQAASTAAGPAFEGMNISHGMLALPGAVYRAEDEDGIKLSTIDDRPPRGICGTGLIDIVAVGRSRGLITAQGAVTAAGKAISLAPGISLEQKDVRELQLAAAAVKSGMKMMLASAGVSAADLDGLLIAGAFGNYLNIARAVSLGLLPSIDPRKISFLGNASLAGARVLLISLETRRHLESLVGGVGHFPLASQPSFQDTFIGALEFTPWG